MTTLTGFRRIKDSSSCHDEATKSSGSSAKTCLRCARSLGGRNAATLKAVALMIYQKCRAKFLSGRGFDRKKPLFDRKQTFSDKKMAFRRTVRVLR